MPTTPLDESMQRDVREAARCGAERRTRYRLAAHGWFDWTISLTGHSVHGAARCSFGCASRLTLLSVFDPI